MVDGVVQGSGLLPAVLSPHPCKFDNRNQAFEYAKLAHPKNPSQFMRKLVWNGAIDATLSGLTKKHLKLNAAGKIVSIAKSKHGKKFADNLEPAPLFKKSRSKSRSRSASKGKKTKSKSRSRSRSKSKGKRTKK